ncbi:hypothetical protein AB0G95_21710 [Streptomyces virginiae]|uniref:hypothetical protein n=1 Tax=Streptomyces virginiae TaxID=1961 RepID=UPI00343F4E60
MADDKATEDMTVSEVRADLIETLNRVGYTATHVRVSRYGRTKGVIVDADWYARACAALGEGWRLDPANESAGKDA